MVLFAVLFAVFSLIVPDLVLMNTCSLRHTDLMIILVLETTFPYDCYFFCFCPYDFLSLSRLLRASCSYDLKLINFFTPHRGLGFLLHYLVPVYQCGLPPLIPGPSDPGPRFEPGCLE